METFYRVDHVQTSSCVLYTNESEARAQSLGTVELGLCHECGFIQNVAFNKELVDYTVPYEESQAASAKFRSFAEKTIEGLVQRYDLRGKTVLDVGCGKAEWLAMACRIGGMRGIGIDPAYVAGRLSDADEARFDVVIDFFDYRSQLSGDLIACRHTLEHVPETLTSTQLLRIAASRTEGSVLFLEVPDGRRILTEGAFWDVYYEHCAYFTEESLTNMLRLAEADVLDLRLAYDRQYLIAEAQSGLGAARRDPGPLIPLASAYSSAASVKIDQWASRIGGRSGPVVVWGASSKAVGFIAAIGADSIVAAVDINPAKQDAYLPGSGIPVVAPNALTSIAPDLVVAMNPIYLDEIQAELDRVSRTSSLVALT